MRNDELLPTKKPRPLLGLFVVSQEKGFTLVELIVALIISGILAAVIIPRWQGETGFEARQFRDETVAALRLAQKSAIAARRKICVTFTSSQVSFRLAGQFADADCSGPGATAFPGGEPLTVTGARGATYSGQPVSLIFDEAGRPNAAVTFIVNNLADLPIMVEAETGYVH